MRSLLPRTYDLFLDFSRAMTVAKVHEILLRDSSQYGADKILAALIPRKIVRPADQPSYVILGHWPQDWATRYFERQYVRKDPTLAHSLEADGPLDWSELSLRAGEPCHHVMQEARAFGLIEGLTIPQITIDCQRVALSFAGDSLDHSPEARAMLTILAWYGVSRVLQLRAATFATSISLSRRERECLLWTAEGRSMADTATILGISVKAVEKYLATARAKLNALTTTQAVAQAMRHGLL